MQQAEDRLERERLVVQVAIARALADCAHALAVSSTGEGVRSALQQLALAADLDVVGVSRVLGVPDLGSCLSSELWVDVDVVGNDAPRMGLVSFSEIPATVARLAAGEIHTFGTPSELPERDRRLVTRSPAGLKALVEVPIFVDEGWEGSVLFGSRTEHRRWSDEEIHLLRSLADLFAATWSRDQALDEANAAIAERDTALHLRAALIESSTALFGGGAADRPIAQAVRSVLDAVGGSIAFVDRNLEGRPGRESFRTEYAVRVDGSERMDDLEVVPWAALPEMYQVLRAGRSHAFECLDDLGPVDRRTVEGFVTPVEAEIDHPIMVRGEFLGTVGIGDIRPRAWTTEEKQTVAAVAAMIGAHWESLDSRRRLESLLEAKDRFLATVSHELRTPLTAVVGMAEVLRETGSELSPDEREEYVELVAEQSLEMANLVEDLLVVARAEEARLTVVPARVEVARLAAAVVRALRPALDVEISVDTPAGHEVYADPLRARQILRNLVVNARRHGGPHVSIVNRAVGETVEIAVSDDGPGVPPDLVETVFDPYVSNQSDSGRTGSIGLGLTVSRTLARLMGGDVTLLPSEQGATFVLTLPASPA